MKITDIMTDEFLNRLKVVYGESDANKNRLRLEALAEKFASDFVPDADMRFFSAPGRTEVSGNHTDHNNGKVIAAAVNLDAVACVSATTDGKIRANSDGYRPIEINTADLEIKNGEAGKSAALIRGICARFKQLGYNVGGFNAEVTSDVLSGSGLSSSAAYEVLIATILNYLYNDGKIDAVTIAQASQYAENVYFRKPCGLMDQTACSVGGFVEIDFKNTEKPVIKKVDFDSDKAGMALCIIDTGGTHADLTDDYASIRLEMNSVAKFFGKKVLRDVEEEDVLENLKAIRETVSDRALLRAMHFYEENKRVDLIADALSEARYDDFKKLLIESGRSSFMYNQNCFTTKRPYEQPVSLALCLAEKYLEGEGGYRVHGGGFAGTIQIFLPKEKAKSFTEKMSEVFGEKSCYILKIRNNGGCEI